MQINKQKFGNHWCHGRVVPVLCTMCSWERRLGSMGFRPFLSEMSRLGKIISKAPSSYNILRVKSVMFNILQLAESLDLLT